MKWSQNVFKHNIFLSSSQITSEKINDTSRHFVFDPDSKVLDAVNLVFVFYLYTYLNGISRVSRIEWFCFKRVNAIYLPSVIIATKSDNAWELHIVFRQKNKYLFIYICVGHIGSKKPGQFREIIDMLCRGGFYTRKLFYILWNLFLYFEQQLGSFMVVLLTSYLAVKYYWSRVSRQVRFLDAMYS